MQFLFVMDPLETMHPEKDTTFAFIRAALNRGHSCLHCLPEHINVHNGIVTAFTRDAYVSTSHPRASYGDSKYISVRDVDAVIIRKDPPFDVQYLNATQILELVREHTFIMNDPRGLRDADEKLFALHFAEWMPRTTVTASASLILEFTQSCGGSAVIKPIGSAGGRGVLKLTYGDVNTRSIIDLLTCEGRRTVMVQEFLPEVEQGDKRVLLLDGNLLGAVLRVPAKGELRANIHVGGSVVACTVTDAERSMIASIGGRLREAGLYFVGIDVVGERLTEVNVTSPTGIQELGRLTDTVPEDDVISWIEKKVVRFAEFHAV